MELALIRNSILRSAIRRNLVSFPAQLPSFMRRGDLQERIVQLYFVRGWELPRICDRYRLGKSTVRKLLSNWKIRAVAGGYIQEIDPDTLTVLANDPELRQLEGGEREDLDAFFVSPDAAWHTELPVARQ